MAGGKKQGFTQDEIKMLSSLSQDQLDQLVYSKRGLPENISQNTGGGSTGSFSNMQQSVNPNMPQGNLTVDAPTVQPANISDSDVEATLQKLEQTYLDPSTLEARAWYADGSSPEKAIHKAIPGAAWERTKLAFGNRNPQEKVKYLEQNYGAGNVKLSKGGNIAVKDSSTNSWYQLDPVGAGEGDFVDKALEKTRDILADNADIAASVGVGIAAATVAAPLAGASLLGLGATGAVSGLSSATTRVSLGRLMGTYDATPEDTLKDIGLETLLSIGGATFIPGVKYGARQVAGMFKKAAPVLEQAAKESPVANQKLIRLIGATSGQGDEAASHVINNGDKVAQMMAKYAKDPQAAMQANLGQLKDLSKEVIAARNALGQKLYGGFAKDAGEAFNPSVVRTFTGTADESSFDLIKNGVIKFDPHSLKINLNSADDIMKANPVTSSVFAQDGAADVIKPVLNVVNRWNQVRSATGEAAGKQFVAFKQQLGAALQESRKLANDKGMNQAFSEIVNFTDQLKSSYINRSLDYVKNKPEVYQKLMSQLSAADSQYQQVKKAIKPFEEALKRDTTRAEGEAFQSLYNSTFKVSRVSARSAAAKGNLQKTMEMLGEYRPNISNIVDDIGARDAAVAFSPWTRGGLDQAFTAGAVASGNLPAITAVAVRSPKLNYHAANLVKSAYSGMDFVRKLTPSMKLDLIRRPEAIDKLYNTIIQTPGIEAQIGAQLNSTLKGNQ